MKYSQKTLHSSPERARYGVSFVSSKGNIFCRLIKIELYKIFAIINRAIKGLHCIWMSFVILMTDLGPTFPRIAELFAVSYHNCLCCHETRGLIQYRIRHLIVRSHKISKAQDQLLELSSCSEIWQGSQQPAKVESDMSILTPNLAPSRLCKILR